MNEKFKSINILLPKYDSEKLEQIILCGKYATATDFFRMKIREEVV
jgi:Arc/MetJ-type ribon-helix-helix transcriptional regulator